MSGGKSQSIFLRDILMERLFSLNFWGWNSKKCWIEKQYTINWNAIAFQLRNCNKMKLISEKVKLISEIFSNNLKFWKASKLFFLILSW